MKTLQPTTQFRKDLKRYKKNQKKLAALKDILEMLKCEIPIPPEFSPHKLHANYRGCMECHVGNDFLLIWVDEQRDIIELVRLGSHSELFG